MRLNRKKIQERGEFLIRVAQCFREYCHEPDCKHISFCPKLCECREGREGILDLHTSIAWSIASDLVGYSESFAKNPTKLKEHFKVLESVMARHQSKYPVLTRMVFCLIEIDIMERDMEECIRWFRSHIEDHNMRIKESGHLYF